MKLNFFSIVLISIMLSVFLVSCNSVKDSEYVKITADEAKKKMEENSDIIIVDVRTEAEYKQEHIENAISIPVETINNSKPEQLPDLNAEILVYCRTGVRSKEATKKLISLGYKNVYDFGGIQDWTYGTVTQDYENNEDSEKEIFSFGEFTSTDLDGNEISNDIFKNNELTMVNIWATFCNPCLAEMPELGVINLEYKEQGFEVVGIVIDTLNSDGSISNEQVDMVKEIVAMTGADYKHILPSESLISIKLKDVYSVPETVFVDKNGNVVDSYLGAKSKEKWEKIIDENLKKVKEVE